jgi:hypothetical protein
VHRSWAVFVVIASRAPLAICPTGGALAEGRIPLREQKADQSCRERGADGEAVEIETRLAAAQRLRTTDRPARLLVRPLWRIRLR